MGADIVDDLHAAEDRIGALEVLLQKVVVEQTMRPAHP